MAYILTVLSNFVFLVPTVEAVKQHRWTRACIYLGIVIFSSMYHMCNSFEGHCVFDAHFHRQLDFFFAQFVIPATALYIIIFPHDWLFLERFLLIGFAVGIVLIQVTAGEVFSAQLALVAAAFALMLLYWIGYAVWLWAVKKQKPDMPPYDWEYFFWGIALTAVASSLFATESQNHNFRWAIHSCWHALAAMGQYFILMIRPPAPRYANMDALIHDQVVSKWAHNEMRMIHHTPAGRI